MSEREPLNPAERVTLACSLLVLAVLVGLIVAQLLAPRTPAEPVVRVEGTERRSDLHHVEVAVTNEGDKTAANVQVRAELSVDGQVTESDQVIDFLAGGAVEDLVFVFDDDPDDGELTVEVGGFTVP